MYERVGRRGYTPIPDEIPGGLCECGCGQATEIATITNQGRRWFKGHPKPHLPFHAGKHKKQADHWNWKGGRHRTSAGYIMRLVREHPNADRYGYVWEHRLVVESLLGRYLERWEEVHHINHDKTDNRPVNLAVLTHAEHRAAHAGRPHNISPEGRKSMSAAGKKGAAARWKKTK